MLADVRHSLDHSLSASRRDYASFSDVKRARSAFFVFLFRGARSPECYRAVRSSGRTHKTKTFEASSGVSERTKGRSAFRGAPSECSDPCVRAPEFIVQAPKHLNVRLAAASVPLRFVRRA